MENKPPIKSSKPKFFGLLQVLILFHTVRVTSLMLLGAVGSGSGVATTFAIPFAIGDITAGITAPLVVLALRRGGLRSWAAAIAWSAFGLTDIVLGTTEEFLVSPNATAAFPILLIMPPIFITMHLIPLFILLNRSTREYFAQKELVL